MRDSMPVILVGLVVAFLVTIVFEWGMDYLGWAGRGGNYVGKINGKSISYQEFSELVRRAAENQKTQPNAEVDELQMSQIRDQVWNNLVTKTLIDEEINRMGIVVTDDEIVDWVRGPNPPEFLRRQFTDSLGNFNRAAYESAMQDPRNKEVWVQVEQGLRQQKLQEKLQSIVLASVRATESEILQRFAEQNVRFEAEYILFDPTRLSKENEIQLSEADMRRFYNEHSDDYKVDATRRIKYVTFKEEASPQDTQAIVSDMQEVLRRVKEGGDFLEIARQYGNVKKGEAFFRHGELSPSKEEAIFSAKVGDIVGPVKDVDGFHLFKIEEERQGKDDFVHVSHILISIEDSDSMKALRTAREVLVAARRGESFSDLAVKHSKDPGSASRGGDLGWFGKGRMVKPFEDAAFNAPIGRIVGPVRTQFGYHIIKVGAKSKREIRVTDFAVPVKPSSQTRNTILQRAQDFAYLAKENGFEKEAKIAKYEIQETPAFTKGSAIPGFGVNEAVSRFAFEGKTGAVSDVIDFQFGYAVVMSSEARPAGIKPFDEVKASVEPRALREKRMERMKALAQGARNSLQPGDSLGTITLTRRELNVTRTGSFSSSFIPTVGRDPAFVGTITAMRVSEISKPIEGVRGCYLIKLLSRTDVDTALYRAQREALRNSITQEKRSRFLTQWLDDLKKAADIEDNRVLFYR
jgi:parvulin-like peptidyl-prolyl isomerase